MKRAAILTTLLCAAATAAAQAGAVHGHAKPVRKTVKVLDDYYAPLKLTVPKNSTIKWTWPYGNVNTHDVKLAKGPKSAKRFASDPAAQSFTFTRKLTVAGTYHIICTFHQSMKMTIVVK